MPGAERPGMLPLLRLAVSRGHAAPSADKTMLSWGCARLVGPTKLDLHIFVTQGHSRLGCWPGDPFYLLCCGRTVRALRPGRYVRLCVLAVFPAGVVVFFQPSCCICAERTLPRHAATRRLRRCALCVAKATANASPHQRRW
jgi:hypothetical protein